MAVAFISLASFYWWPAAYIPEFILLKTLLFMLTAALFVRLQLKLNRWQASVILTDAGEITLNGRAANIDRSMVTPLVCFIYFNIESARGTEQELVPVFRDMLTDSDYRRLCRLLLGHKKGSHLAP